MRRLFAIFFCLIGWGSLSASGLSDTPAISGIPEIYDSNSVKFTTKISGAFTKSSGSSSTVPSHTIFAPDFTLSTNEVIRDEDFADKVIVTVNPTNPDNPSVVGYLLDAASLAITFAKLEIDNQTGQVTITAIEDNSGTAEITVVAQELLGDSFSQTFTLTINPVNDAPTFVIAGNPVTIAVNAGAQSIPGFTTQMDDGDADFDQNLNFVLSPAEGNTLNFDEVPEIDENGTLNFEVEEDASGTATFEVVLEDDGPQGGENLFQSVSQSFTITVTPLDNNAPVAQDQTDVVTNEGTTVSIELQATDGDGDPLDFILEILPNNGVLVQDSNTVIYTPSPNFVGDDVFTFKVNDGTEDSNIATVNITVTAINGAPSFTIENDPEPIVVNAGAQSIPDFATEINDGNAEIEQGLEFVLTQTSGELTFEEAPNINQEGTLTYQAATDATGNATFEVYLQDDGVENNQSNVSTFTVTVIPPTNQPPTASPGITAATNQGTPVSITLSGTDPDNDVLTFQIAQTPENGTVSSPDAENKVVYTPAQGFFGEDTFTFLVNDGSVDSAPATVTIAVNALPIANAGEDQSLTDTDGDGAQAVTLNGSASADPDGSIATYLWTEAGSEIASGANPSVILAVGPHTITLTVTDNQGASSTDVVAVTVTEAETLAPSFTLDPEQLILEEDFTATTTVVLSPAPNSPEANYILDNTVDFANVSIDPNSGLVNITPIENASGGPTQINITATDVNDNTNTFTASFSLQLNPVNDAPVVINPIANIPLQENAEAFSLDISNVFSDVEDSELILTAASNNTGLVQVSINGVNLNITITPDTFGEAIITLTAQDSEGENVQTTFSIIVNEAEIIPPAFTLNPASFSGQEDFAGTQIINIISNENTPAADYSFAPELSSITFANVSFDAENRQINITAVPNAFGSGEITVTATDQGNNENTAQLILIINVAAVNDNPSALAIPDVEVEEGTASQTINLPDFFSDVEDATLSYSVEEISNTALLSASIDENTGVLTLTFNENASGSSSIRLKATDSGGLFAETTFQVVVTNVNDAPIIAGQAAPIAINEDTPYTIELSTLLVSDVDHAISTLALSVQDGTNYSRSGNSITPALNYSGPLEVPVLVTDPNGAQSNIFNLAITVNPVNDPPLASTIEEIKVGEDAPPLSIDLTLYFTDVDNPALTYTVASNSNPGLVNPQITGGNLQLTFVANQSGNATLNLQASDGDAQSNPNLVLNIVVNPVNDRPILVVNQFITSDEDSRINLAGLLNANSNVLSVTDPDNTYPNGFSIEAQDENNTNNYTLAENNTVVVPDQNFDGNLDIPIRVSDGSLFSEYQILRISLNQVNDPPRIAFAAAETNAAIQFNRGDAPVNITNSITISDVDNINLNSATISFVSSPLLFYSPEEDELQFTNQSGITGVWNAQTGTLTLSGTASINDYRDAIRNIKYFNKAATLTPRTRQLLFKIVDGGGASNGNDDRRFIQIEDSNLPPELTDFEKQVPEDEPLLLVSSDFGSNYTDDVDSFDNTIYITRLPDTNKGRLVVNNETITDNQLDPAIGGFLIDFNGEVDFRYVPSADFNGTDSFGWTALDSETQPGTLINSASVNITVLPVGDAPRIIAPSSISVSEDATFSFSDTRRIVIEDVDNDSDTLIVDLAVQEGLLSFNNEAVLNNIVFLVGDGSPALNIRFKGLESALNNALTSLRYTSSVDFSGSDRLVITATDPQNNAGNTNVNISVNAVNDLPILSNIETDTLNYTENGEPMLLTTTLNIEDLENDNIVAATISVAENFVADQDRLGFTPTDGITGRVSGNRLILTGNASIEVYEALLRGITYVNISEAPQTATRKINFQVTDVGNGSSNVLSRFVNVIQVDDSIQISNVETEALAYYPGDGQQFLSQSITISDADDEGLSSAVIRFGEGSYLALEDSLIFESADFTISWNDALGTLTIEGDNTLAAYQEVFRAVQYINTADIPTAGSRLIYFTAYRNGIASNEAIRELRVVVNEPPLLSDFAIGVLKNSIYIFKAEDFSNHYNDPDNSSENLTFVGLRISKLPTRGLLYLNDEVITQEILDTEGALAVSTENLNQLTYQPDNAYTGSDSLRWNAFDGEEYALSDATVIFNITDLAVDAGADMEICQSDPLTLTVAVGGGSGNYTFNWSCDQADCAIQNANTAETSVSPVGTTNYYVSVTDGNGVTTNSDTIVVSTLECYGLPLSIPSAFTPNGDGPNDSWIITNIETYENQLVEVFDRYGKQVFFTENYQRPWDGSRNGQLLPAGTYYYLIKLNNGEQYHRGSVSILK